MSEITAVMQADHRACDEHFASFESAVVRSDWEAAAAAGAELRRATLRHFRMEEDVLFPAFETATGMASGPTVVMRMEHDQMRALLDELRDASEVRDRGRCLGLTESFMVLVQQHNMKEEQILYPMADRAVPSPADVVTRMQAVEAPGN